MDTNLTFAYRTFGMACAVRIVGRIAHLAFFPNATIWEDWEEVYRAELGLYFEVASFEVTRGDVLAELTPPVRNCGTCALWGKPFFPASSISIQPVAYCHLDSGNMLAYGGGGDDICTTANFGCLEHRPIEILETRCKNCRHWSPEDWLAKGHGLCGLAGADRGVANHSTSLAVARDHEAYSAELTTQAEFGCVQFERTP